MRVIIYLGLLFALAACRNRNGGLESEAASVQSSQQSIAFIRSFVESKLRQQGREPSELFSFEGHCLDYSALWIKIFSDSGIKVALQQTSGVYYPKVNGKSVQRTPTHFFLAVNPDSADEIIIDPTYGQFFAEAERLDLRPVLVATKEEVFAVYS
ncbi:MAG: hypothetical protein RJB13_866 [Pseudomonadota bacterium]